MTPHEFIQKWQAVQLSERSASQQHFLDLCDLIGQPKPATADPEGTWYTFERGVQKTDLADNHREGDAPAEPKPGEKTRLRRGVAVPNTSRGWADVWLRGHFGWEFKGKEKDLTAAY